MNITKLAKKPTLVKVTLDDTEIVTNFGEAVEFWMYDVQPMHVFFSLAALENADPKEVAEIMSGLILNENGKPVMTKENGMTIDSAIMVAAITKIMATLGKSSTVNTKTATA